MKTILHCVTIIFLLLVSASAEITLKIPNEITAESDCYIEVSGDKESKKIVLKADGKWVNKELINNFPKVSGTLVLVDKKRVHSFMLEDGKLKLISINNGGAYLRFYMPASEFLQKIYP
jgi:hypothetical protein